MAREVLIYELNEVPWHIIDHYVAQRPEAHLAQLLERALCVTTTCEDPEPLQPWRTWPAFHNSLYTAHHGSYDLGQDPESFCGDPLWDAADRAGKVVGIFGPMQSWPAKQFINGGFYVPDTFARTPDTFPAELRRFQQFNLAMTRENTFNPEGRLSALGLVRAGADLLVRGMTPRSIATSVHHLVEEAREPRHQASRSTIQALPAFDLYWRLHKRTSPDLSIFFTNHVAGMMHRYWGDGVPNYQSSSGYEPDPVFAGFVLKAMDIFDRQLGTLMSWLDTHPNTVLIIASSMGQGAIDKEAVDDTFVLDAPEQLLRVLGLEGEVGMAMYPRTSVRLASEVAAEAAVAPLSSVRTATGALFEDFRVYGRTASFAIDQFAWERCRTEEVSCTPAGAAQPVHLLASELGVSVRTRMGGGNTAYHVPEGIFIAAGAGVRADARRALVSVLDAAPSILEVLGVPAPATYEGTASIEL